MLSELCGEIRNYFLRDAKRDIHAGTYTISGGELSLPFLIDGQYFRIVGSVLNDGVYQYPASELTDETFDGAVWAMAVPPSFLALAKEIGDWVESNKDALNSPYQSESFGGYSYSKGGAQSAGGVSGYSWQVHFKNQLNQYRRISVL